MNMKNDYLLIFGLLILTISIPLGIYTYDRSLRPKHLPPGTKEFTLTGHSEKGWILDEVKAFDMLSFFRKKNWTGKPVIRVSLNDHVVLKLRSADVSHGFSLKAYDIYIAKGIEPGNTTYVSFTADQPGTFIFVCTVFCGDIHHSMQGTLVVEK